MTGADSTNGLQAALPREHYVDPATYSVERQRVLLREWTCVGRLDDLGLVGESGALRPGRLAVVDLLGEGVLVTVDADGYEVARRVRQGSLGRAVTLIAVTGWGQDSDKAQPA